MTSAGCSPLLRGVRVTRNIPKHPGDEGHVPADNYLSVVNFDVCVETIEEFAESMCRLLLRLRLSALPHYGWIVVVVSERALKSPEWTSCLMEGLGASLLRTQAFVHG